MSEYPEKTCEITNLVSHPKLVTAVLEGRKTEQRRNGVYAHPGDTFELEGVTFEVTRLEQQRLGDMTDTDAKAEGFDSLEAYRGLIMRMHKGMDWDPDQQIWVHAFRRA